MVSPPAARAPAAATHPKRLLLVDDDLETLESIGEALRIFAGWTIVTADSGAKALLRLQEIVPDALVTDYRMPGMNGIELTRAAHRSSPHLPVVIITAFNDADLRNEAIQEGVCDVIGKPLDVEDLVDAVVRCWTAHARRQGG